MSTERVVVIADPIDREALARLKAGPCRVIDASSDPTALPSQLADAWALIVRSRTKVTADLLSHAPHLELVARAGVGVDNVDLAATSKRGIKVVNAPTAATQSVAELTIAFYLMLVRGLSSSIASMRSGKWERGTHGHELAGKTVGFVGYGRIAREVAHRLEPFHAHVIAFDPYVPNSGDATEMVTLDDLLARADIVSLHAASTADTRHLLDARAFERMKPGTFLVNVARGALVDEAALLSALASGRLAGAALDVYEVEPPINQALLTNPNVIPTPHLGASTHEAQSRAGSDTVDEVLRALKGEPLTALVPAPGGAP